MIVQALQTVQKQLCDEKMYFNGKYTDMSEDGLTLLQNDVISSDTYFNSFSLDIWRKYTILNNLQLNFIMEGSALVRLFCAYLENGEKILKKVSEQKIESTQLQSFNIAFKDLDTLKGSCYYEITCLSRKARVITCDYVTELEESKLPEINLAAAICTFKREECVLKNLELLRQRITENQSSMLYNHFYVYVSDNGKSLDPINMRNIKIFPNENYGGSGGFTRGMLEILKDKEKRNITNTIIMDDDIIFDYHVFQRVYCLLRLLKPEYQNSTVAGAMLKLSNRTVQQENGAIRSAYGSKIYGKNMKLTSFEQLLENEHSRNINFSGWWFTCVSMNVISENNLPLPLFIHGDDIEYGLRNENEILMMNGIGVWHSTENKESSILAYYDNRNDLIINAIYDFGSLKKTKKYIFLRMLVKALRYRYKDAYLIGQAVEDFCKGIEWIKETDACKLHKENAEYGYREQEEIPIGTEIKKVQSDSINVRFYGKLLLNFLLPACRDTIYVDNTMNANNYYLRKEVVITNSATRKGYRLCKSYKELKNVWKCYTRVSKILDKKYDCVTEQYRTRCKELENMGFWKKYLHME